MHVIKQEPYFHFAYVSKDESSPGFSDLVSCLSLIHFSFHNSELKSPSLQTEPPLATLLNTSTHIAPPQHPRAAPSAHTHRAHQLHAQLFHRPSGPSVPVPCLAVTEHASLNPPLASKCPFPLLPRESQQTGRELRF